MDFVHFAEKLADRAQRWQWLEAYMHAWGLPTARKSRITERALTQAEVRLGRALPGSLREWYLLPCQPYQLEKPITCNQMILPEELEIQDDILIFHGENQWCCQWGILVQDMDQTDPPVYFGDVDWSTQAKDWVFQNATLSEFAVQMTLLETYRQGGFTADASARPSILATLASHYSPTGLPEWRWPDNASYFYGGEDFVLVATGQKSKKGTFRGSLDLSLGARTQARLGEAMNRLNVGWENIKQGDRFLRYTDIHEEQLADLRLWACVAFAARCARRAQRHFRAVWPKAPASAVETLERAITIAEAFAGQAGGSSAEAASLGAAAWQVKLKADNSSFKPALAAACATTASAAAYTAASAASLSNDRVTLCTRKGVGQDGYRAVDNAARFPETREGIGRDFAMLLDAQARDRWDDRTPVPVSFFRPLDAA
ncbi:MAG TPA: hypothetical protein VFA07_01820 [Chthonomonadaceae bacterium]|nr:hypothetical protein [Chthonomonadaceae bacterium]